MGPYKALKGASLPNHTTAAAASWDSRQSRWTYFTNALIRDQAMLKTAVQAPAIVQMAEHVKAVKHRSVQAKRGEDAVSSWSEKFCKVIALPKVELLQSPLSAFRTSVAARLDTFTVISINCAI